MKRKLRLIGGKKGKNKYIISIPIAFIETLKLKKGDILNVLLNIDKKQIEIKNEN